MVFLINKPVSILKLYCGLQRLVRCHQDENSSCLFSELINKLKFHTVHVKPLGC